MSGTEQLHERHEAHADHTDLLYSKIEKGPLFLRGYMPMRNILTNLRRQLVFLDQSRHLVRTMPLHGKQL
jgi:hypothetical protein